MSAAAAIYERELDASTERIWENVLDWEHLPYLHAQAFAGIRVESADAGGWKAEVELPGTPGNFATVDVRLDRPSLRYTTRTLAGSGAGTEITTSLFPREERRTGIRVEFHVPWAPRSAAEAIGAAYRGLYVTLWDQDEAMMRERQRVLDAAAAVSPGENERSLVLGRVHDLASRLPLDVGLAGRRFRVVSIDGRLHAYDLRCPHLGGPLGEGTLHGCEAVCPWHGYRFDVRTGQSCDGRGLRLGAAARIDVDACGGDVTLRLP
ncbi:MAG TPA: Rieske (2Fe-2S) protein [Candidatus Binatia bacterium]